MASRVTSSVLLALQLLCWSTVWCQLIPECTDGDLRLTVDGVPQNSSGQVEVCAFGVWGVVCDDSWDLRDATVVCRQLGFNFSVAFGESFFAVGPPREILLDEVGCNGTEASLLNCPNDGIFNHDCSQFEHAGVICTPECMDGDTRLTIGGVPQNSSGQVEVCAFGVWGVVCDDSWDLRDATVVCRQLGFNFSVAFGESFFAVGPPREILLDEVGCNGTEASLLNCPNDGIFNHDCSQFEHAGVICTPECTDGDTRLTIGGVPQNSSGQVEVCQLQVWGVVCDDEWDARDATVFCRQLGYEFGQAVRKSSFERGPAVPILLDDVECTGSELSLLGCPHVDLDSENCDNTEHAGVICSNTPQCERDEVRLVNGTGENDGTVQYCLFGQWETICDKDWTNAAASVVCRQLGRPLDGVTGTFSGEDAAEASFLQFFCDGDEPSLSGCPNRTRQLSCLPGNAAAGVSCIDRQVTNCTNGEVRIVSDGLSERFGRVEICHNGVWGRVCDNIWDDNDARVVCRQLDYPDGVATRELAFQLSSLRPTFLDRVACDGTESSLLECGNAVLGEFTCFNQDFAGVACNSGTVERCMESDNNSSEIVSEQILADSFGRCESYAGTSEMCRNVYESSSSVFVLSRRSPLTQTELATQLDDVIATDLFNEERCTEPIMRILCHYFFPPCGANNVTFPPTTVCREDCVQVQSDCSRDWTIVQDILEAQQLERINCFSTEEAVAPLPSCCTSAGVVTIPVQAEASVGAIVGGVLAGLLVLFGVFFCIALLVLAMKFKRSKMVVQRMQMDVLSSPPPTTARQHLEFTVEKESNSPRMKKSGAVPNPYSHHKVSSPTEELPRSASEAGRKILNRFSANFARQMSGHLRITKDQLVMEEKIGTGEFGIVYRGLITDPNGGKSEVVAVKTLKGLYDHNEIHKILDESLKMKFFNHPNVLSLIGVCLDTGAAPYIIMPYMANGSLQQYLKKERANLILGENVDTDEVEDVKKRLTVMCLHVAQGMEYLAGERFIHRDLAARNCMIDENFVIRIADFGLSEDIYAKSYFRQEKDVSIKLPVKWMAPESLNDGIFSEKSDVWSYGVTCWEVFSGGKTPYPGVEPQGLSKMLDNGERLSKPSNAACPDHMFGVMQECWEADSRDRPTFSDLVTSVSAFATNLAGYVDFSEFNPFDSSERTPRQSRTSSVDGDRVLSKQSSAASVTTADSDVQVRSKNHSPQPKDRKGRKNKSKSAASISITERTRRFLPKKKTRKTSDPSRGGLEGVVEEGGRQQHQQQQQEEVGGAGIRINIEPASLAGETGFLD